MSPILQLINTQHRRQILNGLFGSIALLAICFGLVASQKPNSGSNRNPGRESNFLREISEGNGLNALLEASARTRLDGVYVEIDEHVADENGRVFVTRRFNVELISADYGFVDKLKKEIERRLQANRLQVDHDSVYPAGFNLDYSSACLIGAIDLRAVHDSGDMFKSKNDTYRLFFVFHESFCK